MRYFVIIGLALLASCNNNSNPDHDPEIVTPHVGIDAPVDIKYSILSQFPHDTGSYTQGLEIYNGKLYEGTGDYEMSALQILDRKTGKIQQKHVMGSSDIFGEGITIFKNKIYQLTWQSHKAYQYKIDNIETPEKTFDWPYEGWGLTHDSSSLIISDGSANIYFVDAETFKIKKTVAVKDDQGPVNLLNELEYVNGMIYANIYTTNIIVKIDAENGHVVGRMNMSGLLQQNEIIPDRTDVLNGIAYDSTSKNFLITGKRWPKMFEVKVN